MSTIQEETTTPVLATQLPSFSIVYETENLSSVELENIFQSLASLAAQDLPIEQANEFLIIDGGNAPEEVIEQLCSTYSWINVRRMPGIGYYEAKMAGANLVTGEIVVFCDSDCIYVPNWLSALLSAFVQYPAFNIVAGETSTPVRNLYELAIAFHYFFPRYSKQVQPYETDSYFLNNVAFRRDFLLQNPIPTNLPVYRGNCSIHSYVLCQLQTHKVLQHPQARATHEPPTVSFSFWRYLLLGSDFAARQQIKARLAASADVSNYLQLIANAGKLKPQPITAILPILRTRLTALRYRMRTVVREDQQRKLSFPLTLPLMLWFEVLHSMGLLTEHLKPGLLRQLYRDPDQYPDQAAAIANSELSTTK